MKKEELCQGCVNLRKNGSCKWHETPFLRTAFKDKYGEIVEIWECRGKIVPTEPEKESDW